VNIKSFHITRYGPLSYRMPVAPAAFTLFFGNNEDGKTLTIDALIKLLLGRKVREFRAIDRVEEEPEGFVVLEDREGKQVNLPKGGELPALLGITSGECGNIFIIRNSDLSIVRESEFFTGLMDRLTGLRMEEIARIKNKLIDLAKVTAGGVFRDIRGEKLKSRIESAQATISKIESLSMEIENEGYDTLVQEMVKTKEKIEVLETRLKLYENARRREQYEKGKLALENLEGSAKELQDLEPYMEKDLQKWRESEKNILRITEEVRELEEERTSIERERKEIRERIIEVNQTHSLHAEKKKGIDELLKPLIREYETKKSAHVAEKVKARFYTAVLVISAALLGLSILGMFFRPALFFTVLVLLFSLCAVLFGFLKGRYIDQRARLERGLEQIHSTISQFGLHGEDLLSIKVNLQEFEETCERIRLELDRLRVEEGALERQISQLGVKSIPERKGYLDVESRSIEELKERTGESSLERYTEKLELKRALLERISRQQSILQSLFGGGSAPDSERVAFWKGRVEEIEMYSGEATDVTFSEKLLEQESESLEKEQLVLQEKEGKQQRIRGLLSDIEREVNQILNREGDYLHCETSVDLAGIKRELDSFIDLHEKMRQEALEVHAIFSEIESEKREKVSELFGGESTVSRYFHDITDGRYTEVRLQAENSKIEVIRNDGRAVSVDKLSAGAYDQLYLSIRLALAEQLLKDEKGFFIMDDPFLRADTSRLHRQLATLRRIAKWGWQVLYFSAKEEVKRYLEGKDDVKLIQLPGTFNP